MEMKSYLKSTRERSTVLGCVQRCKRKTLRLGGLFDLNRFNYQFDAAVVSATFKAMIFKSKPLGNPILS